MKLKNKNTGVIGDLVAYDADKGIFAVKAQGGDRYYYYSLAALHEVWEDYEGPKEYWTIDWTCIGVTTNKYSGDDVDDFNKSIGNYFETEEEAELAVRKLKAWKRLKDKGFKAISSNICGDDFVANFKLTDHVDYSQSIDDFDCILDFGGEE